jgi:glycerol kinase
LSYVLALDEGTTSARAIVFTRDGIPAATAQREFAQSYPKPGWVEHDAEEIWSAQMAVAVEALVSARVKPRDIAAIGITNQRETTVVWDRRSGEPIHPAIVWQDRRTAAACDRLKAEGAEPMIAERTGLVLDAYFSGTKIAWLLDQVPGARAKAEAGRLAFGTIDTWLLFKLTSGALHVTDESNASRTLLFNINTRAWDDELLRLFRIPREVLPEVRSSSEIYGEVKTSLGLTGLKIGGIAGDQQASLFGQMCFTPGLIKSTYGTGCFVLANTGDHVVRSQNRLLGTVAWKLGGRSIYALEGSVFIGGAVVKWLRDELHLIARSEDVEALARSVPDSGGVYLVPAFVGLGAPHWDSRARGLIVGLTRGSGAGHIARAALESIAFQVADLLRAMRADMKIEAKELVVDGGVAKNDLVMQFQADLIGAPVVRPAVTETTALGAAYLAGLAAGVWKDLREIEGQRKIERRFEPQMSRDQATALRARWTRALERAKNWEE